MDKATLTRESLRHALRTIHTDREVLNSQDANLFSKEVLDKIEYARQQDEIFLVEAVISELFDEMEEEVDE